MAMEKGPVRDKSNLLTKQRMGASPLERARMAMGDRGTKPMRGKSLLLNVAAPIGKKQIIMTRNWEDSFSPYKDRGIPLAKTSLVGGQKSQGAERFFSA